jgi:hypothetical protein
MADNDKKGFKPGAIPIYEAPSGLRVYREEDLTDERREHFRKLRDGAEFQQALKEQSELPGWEYAIADKGLPENADAAVVRFPDPGTRAVLVFSAAALHDHLVSLARVALVVTQSTPSLVPGQQIVLVWSDGTLKTGGKVTKLEYLSLSQQGETEKFRRLSGIPRRIEGIGEIRILGTENDF